MGSIAEPGRCPHGLQPGTPAGPGDTGLVCHLHECEGLSTYRIGELVGMDRQRVGRLPARSGVAVRPRGRGSRRGPAAGQPAGDTMATRYAQERLTLLQVAERTGVSPGTVRSRIRDRGVPIRTRGRLSREDRMSIGPEVIRRLYADAGLSSADVGRALGVSPARCPAGGP